MRVEFELTETEEKFLLNAMKPTTYMVFGGLSPLSQQERANKAWQTLGLILGFDGMTVRPVPGKSQRFFTAEKLG